MPPTESAKIEKTVRLWLVLLALVVLPSSYAAAQSFEEDFSIWPLDLKVNGTVIACVGPEVDSAAVERFQKASGEKESNIVALWLDAQPPPVERLCSGSARAPGMTRSS